MARGESYCASLLWKGAPDTGRWATNVECNTLLNFVCEVSISVCPPGTYGSAPSCSPCLGPNLYSSSYGAQACSMCPSDAGFKAISTKGTNLNDACVCPKGFAGEPFLEFH
eukprot:gene18805-25351_t